MTEEGLWAYKPTPRQLRFLTSRKKFRILTWANQSGKTLTNTVDAIWTASRTHPYRLNKTTPVQGRCVGVTFSHMQKVMVPYFKSLTPRFRTTINDRTYPGLWKEDWDKAFTWTPTTKQLVWADGSFVEFLSYDQDVDVHSGTPRDFIWFDEEPPEAIWQEGLARQITRGVDIRLSATLLNYSPWVDEEILSKAMEHPDDFDIIPGTIDDNPYADASARAAVEAMISDETVRRARLYGEPVVYQSRIWPTFGPHNTCEPFAVDPYWPRTVIMDPHDVKPAAVAWYFQHPSSGKEYQYREAEIGGDFQQITDEIKRLSAGEVITKFMMDPKSGAQSSKLRNSDSKLNEFRKCGIPWLPAKPCDEVSRDIVKRALYNHPTSGPRFIIFLNCPLAIKQTRAYSYRKPLPSGETRPKTEVLRKNDEFPACHQYYLSYSTVGVPEHTRSGFQVGSYGR